MTEQVPKIKPLVWADHGNALNSVHNAKTPFGLINLHGYGDGAFLLIDPFDCDTTDFKSVSEAKAWCQSEYERRVRECLE
ncbi:hypothetical protein VN12_02175 [Pirellula sp. SH-Sr6A]|nr:hypothetical protein VN12_02175 [Pirellula sp. SH-Sr6A]